VVFPRDGHGGWLTRMKFGTGWNILTSVAGVGDMTLDGKADVLASDTSGVMRLHAGNGAGEARSAVPFLSGWAGCNSLIGMGKQGSKPSGSALLR
jgi:serine protease